MKDFVLFVSSHSKITAETFENLSWAEQVDFILKHLTGGISRFCIHKDFMIFMARYGKECIALDNETGENFAPILFTVAMQRLSKGAVKHDSVNFEEQLRDKFWIYSSAHDDSHVMTNDCLEFIYSGLPVAAQLEKTKDYALKIAWGLVEHLDEEGNRYNYDLYCDNPQLEGKKLFAKAEDIIEKNAPYSYIFSRYSKKHEWQKHKKWLKNYLLATGRWDEFFEKIDVKKGLITFSRRQKIKKEIIKS